MLWIKAFHVVFMVSWFAGLFYLPRLFVYHVMSSETAVREGLKVMERKLMVLMHIACALTWLFGILMLWLNPVLMGQTWLQVKLVLVGLLTWFHFECSQFVRELARDQVRHSHVWHRWFNEIPALFLIVVVILVIVRPF